MAAANNEQGATRLFKNRKQYHKSAWTSMNKRPTPIDLWYDKPFYGRMDPDGNAISLNSAYLKQLSTDSKNVFVLNFVYTTLVLIQLVPQLFQQQLHL